MAHPSDRATRASHQAPAGLDHPAGIPCAPTPGPWSAVGGSVLADGNAKIAMCYGTPRDRQMMADARLIAAAPELYDALYWALKELRLHVPGLCHIAIKKGEAALAKARGEA